MMGPVTDLEVGTIEKRIHIDASPAVVYEVISRPEHVAGWWFDEADFEPTPGSAGVLAAGTPPGRVEVPISVIEAVPGRRFSFRWVAPPAPAVVPPGSALTTQNSVLITFDLTADGDGTLLTVTEEGLRELGWEAAVLEEYYNSHGTVWAKLLADLPGYVAGLDVDGARR
jgi:uncharacterized protein YndB with AHSA1/START domain